MTFFFDPQSWLEVYSSLLPGGRQGGRHGGGHHAGGRRQGLAKRLKVGFVLVVAVC